MGPSSSSPEVDPPNGERGAPGAGAQPKAFDFDAIVVGTGFGGAVTACRLAQAGLKVRILERGRRYALTDLPALPQPNEFMPDSLRWTWGGSQGLWDIRNLEGVTVAQAAAYGGGSLVYANVHLRPPREVFTDAWPKDCQGRPEKLDDYFDLAAHMLDVAPIPEPWRKIGKTKAMAEAFGKAAVEPTDVFFPPLAIQFPTGAAEDLPVPTEPPIDESDPSIDGSDPPLKKGRPRLKPNAYGQPQGPCQRCGACDLGCRYGAKNTLDRNYLALAEQHENVTVRTLAEALIISPFRDRNGDSGYRVDVHDHLTETTYQTTARYLFLCGGAINTTELLLRSVAQGAKDRDLDPALRRGLPTPIANLGSDYFVNADSLAMVLDTETSASPSAGPVITTALVHKEQPRTRPHRPRRLQRPARDAQDRRELPHRDWFMIQDGGYPKEVARFFAAFGSPLLLGRNRFDPGGLGPNLFAPGLAKGDRPDRYTTFLEGAYAAVRDNQLPDILPRNFHQALDDLMKTVRERWHEFLADMAEAVRNEVIHTSPLGRLFRWIGLYRFDWAKRFLYRLSVGLMGATREHILQNTIEVGAHRLGVDVPASLPARLGRLLLGEGYPLEKPKNGPDLGSPEPPERPPENRALLLAMGRDDAPATISIDPATERLVVAFQDDAFPTLGDEERVMRDVAAALKGTLRTSPVWAFARQPITAHSHGGCALGVVTDPHGMVPNYPNLYINDGSLLPTPVGVNPSATIAAIAERNMENFVTRALGRSSIPWQKEKDAAIKWVGDQKDAGVAFEPPNPSKLRARDLRHAPRPESAANPDAVLPHHPIGVTFREMMSGFLSHVTDQAGRLPDPQKARVPVPPFLTGEGQAKKAAETLSAPPAGVAGFDCHAQLVDIGAFLDDPNHVIDLEGTVTIPADVLAAGSAPVKVRVTGKLHLLTDAGTVRRMMIYHLPFADSHGQPYTLVGHKEVEDDPGFDAWLDAATLYTEVYRGNVNPLDPPETDLKQRDIRRRDRTVEAYQGTVVARGILRLGITDFLANQLQGLAASGTVDPTRVIWTLGSFGLYFFGSVQKAYSPQIERFLDLFSRSGWRAPPGTTAISHRPKALGLLKGL